jgi:outer membrane protein assembly factor BamB
MDKRQREIFFIIADLVLLIIIGFLVYVAAKKDFNLRQALSERFHRSKVKVIDVNGTAVSLRPGLNATCFIPTGKALVDPDSVHELNSGISLLGGFSGPSVLLNSVDGSIFKFNLRTMALTMRAQNDFTGCSSLKPYGRNFIFLDISGHFRTFDPGRNEQKELFTYSAGHSIIDVPEIADINADGIKDFIFPNSGGQVVCLDGRTLAPLWIFNDSSDAVLKSPVVMDINNDRTPDCVFAAQNGTVYTVDGKSGWVIWKYPVQKQIKGRIYIGDVNGDGIKEIVFTAGRNSLWCLARNGTKLWSMDIPGSLSPELTLMDVDADGRKEVLVSRDDREIMAVDLLAQNIQWTFSCEGKPLPYTIALYKSIWNAAPDCVFADSTGFLYVLSGKDGRPMSRLQLEEKPVTGLVFAGGSLCFAGASGNVYNLKAVRTGK